MALLSKGGTSSRAMTSLASMRYVASAQGTVSLPTAAVPVSRAVSASSTDLSSDMLTSPRNDQVSEIAGPVPTVQLFSQQPIPGRATSAA